VNLEVLSLLRDFSRLESLVAPEATCQFIQAIPFDRLTKLVAHDDCFDNQFWATMKLPKMVKLKASNRQPGTDLGLAKRIPNTNAWLYLQGNFTTVNVDFFRHATSLRELTMPLRAQFPKEDVDSIFWACRRSFHHIRRLSIKCSNMDNNMLKVICETANQLIDLRIPHSECISKRGFFHLTKLTKLQRLSVRQPRYDKARLTQTDQAIIVLLGGAYVL
jgi:hypothetical protein